EAKMRSRSLRRPSCRPDQFLTDRVRTPFDRQRASAPSQAKPKCGAEVFGGHPVGPTIINQRLTTKFLI
ncbi:MAG: hypothetical protein WEB60_02545, partial [Terrimicrobiaceae bacterium]